MRIYVHLLGNLIFIMYGKAYHNYLTRNIIIHKTVIISFNLVEKLHGVSSFLHRFDYIIAQAIVHYLYIIYYQVIN